MSYKIIKYPDGSSYVQLPTDTLELNKLANDTVFRINSYEDLWHMTQFIDAMANIGYESTITIPCLLDAQADRRFNRYQSAGLKLLLEHMYGLELNYKVSWRIFHPHNPEVVEMMLDNVEIIDNSEFIKEVLMDLGIEGDREEGGLILMSSDAGGFKPLMKLCDTIRWGGETFSASKARSWSEEDGSKLVQQIDRQDFDGKDVLIIDDLLIGGKTLINIASLLKDKNVGNIYAAVSHMTIKTPKKELTEVFDMIFTTNSKYNQQDYDLDPNLFKVFSLFC